MFMKFDRINLQLTSIGDSWGDVHFISFLFAIGQQFPAENSLLSNRIRISTFCSFTRQTFGQKVINCPVIANAWTLAVIHPFSDENDFGS
jgi:hypothetical protein